MERKLRDVRIELQARLGFGSIDQPMLTPILNSFLIEAQEQLYEVGKYKDLMTYWDITAPQGSSIVPYPTTTGKVLNPKKIERVVVDVGNGSPYWTPVKEGIKPYHYNDSTSGYPVRYERRSGGLEFIPARDKAYTVRVFGARELNKLRDDDDVFEIDDRLVFILALSYAKQHYRHPDAKEYLGKASAMLASIKWDNVGPRVFNQRDDLDQVEPRPVVV